MSLGPYHQKTSERFPTATGAEVTAASGRAVPVSRKRISGLPHSGPMKAEARETVCSGSRDATAAPTDRSCDVAERTGTVEPISGSC
jgi:hypothetical protein